MSKILHYLNGDAPLPQFKEAGITGEVAIMREMFCRGELNMNLRDKEYWIYRKSLFNKFHVPPEAYDTSVMSELQKAEGPWDEVVIWYEYDVYCHINMLFLFQWVSAIGQSQKISLAYSPEGTGRNSSDQLRGYFEERKTLNDEEKEFLKAHFSALCDKTDYQHFDQTSAVFPNLEKAIKAYRAQNWSDDPPIQHRILDIIKDGQSSGRSIIKTLLQTDEIYGYGDLQYMLILNAMTDYLHFDPIRSDTMDDYVEQTLANSYRIK